jgi:hypothetical protein
MLGQLFSFGETPVAAIVTLTHALILAVLASVWLSAWLPYFSDTLGTLALVQWISMKFAKKLVVLAKSF